MSHRSEVSAPGPRFRVDPQSHRLAGTRFVASPHYGPRPPRTAVSLAVIHGISLPPDEYGGPWIERLFLGRLDPSAHPSFASLAGLRVSAHLLVRRSGAVVQYVPFDRRAWHAGVSSWQGRQDCNDFSVGIEVEGSAAWPYLGAQYRSLVAVLHALAAVYPRFDLEHSVVGHADVAPGRKSDPWATFDWPRLRRLLATAPSRTAR